jgi:hypothetical protein
MRQAWEQLNLHRESLRQERLFHRKMEVRDGVPYWLLGQWLNRNPAELSRWFTGSSKSFANLAMAMFSLNADWAHLKQLPSRKERRREGLRRALEWIRCRVLKSDTVLALDDRTCGYLEAILQDDKWPLVRRLPKERQAMLERLAARTAVPVALLDAADAQWGQACIEWARVFDELARARLWL